MSDCAPRLALRPHHFALAGSSWWRNKSQRRPIGTPRLLLPPPLPLLSSLLLFSITFSVLEPCFFPLYSWEPTCLLERFDWFSPGAKSVCPRFNCLCFPAGRTGVKMGKGGDRELLLPWASCDWRGSFPRCRSFLSRWWSSCC